MSSFLLKTLESIICQETNFTFTIYVVYILYTNDYNSYMQKRDGNFQTPNHFFEYFLAWARVCLPCHPFAYVAHLAFFRDVWIQAQRAA
jgi:hypothetical protein